MLKLVKHLFVSCAVTFFAAESGAAEEARPTIVLGHGAFAESVSWNGVADDLAKRGYPVVAATNPLRGAASDGAYVAALIGSIKGPVVLVGHSYGGAVISAAANDATNVKALVFVAAFAPDSGESCLELTGKFPGSTLPPTLAPPVALADGGEDLYIQERKFPRQFAADVPSTQARAMAATQRPVESTALAEAAGAPACKTIPSRAIHDSGDLDIPLAAMGFISERAHAKKVVVVPGASPMLMVSHPHEVAALIRQAAAD